MGEEIEQNREEALRLKTLAEQKYDDSNLQAALKYAKRAHSLCPSLDGLSEMVTAFKILRVSAKTSSTPATDTGGGVRAGETPEWYKVLQIEAFSHINTIKKQYKKLALTLHPDKNSFAASEEAFKLVGEAFRVLSDKIRRKEYDMKLRIALQSVATEGGVGGVGVAVDAFWTACSTCRLLHQFQRKYLGHNLMCPSCKKSFKAVEVSENVSGGEEDRVGARSSARIRARGVERPGSTPQKRKMSSVGDVLARSKPHQVGGVSERSSSRPKRAEGSKIGDKKVESAGGVEELEKSRSKRPKTGEEKMTLAEMQVLAKQKMKLRNEKQREKDKDSEKLEKKIEMRSASKGGQSEIARRRSVKSGDLQARKQRSASESGDSDKMTVEDSDFYDFDKDRVERSFKNGQVWAVYDDDDGMPRHYGLIEEPVSVNPFEVKMSWLDLQSNGDEGLICLEKMGLHISCGRFKVARTTSVYSVNIFSHVMDAERAAREVYRVYPKKGSVWALYKENALDNEGRNTVARNRRCYDIVVFLTSYSEIHGLSMAYLEKVEGFRTVFKRKEIGCHAIRWLEKDDVRLFSHQIPARKLSGEEVPDLSKDSWELDPASLPPELLSIGWHK